MIMYIVIHDYLVVIFWFFIKNFLCKNYKKMNRFQYRPYLERNAGVENYFCTEMRVLPVKR